VIVVSTDMRNISDFVVVVIIITVHQQKCSAKFPTQKCKTRDIYKRPMNVVAPSCD